MLPMSARSMRIMLFSHLCSKEHITGAEKLLLFMARELQAQHDCILVVPGEGILSREAREAGIYTVSVSYPLLWEIYTPGPGLQQQLEDLPVKERGAMSGLLCVLGEYAPELVIANTCVNVLPPLAAKALGIPVLWMITEKMIDTGFTPVSVNYINAHADLVAGISEATLTAFGGSGSEANPVLYPSWHPESIQPEQWAESRQRLRGSFGISEDTVLAGYISSDIYPTKGLEHFIEAALQLCPAGPQVQFIIAGRATDIGFYRKCYEKTAVSGYGRRFHWVDFERDIGKIYPAMDVVVVPSLAEEGFGMTALEGMLFGKPVVAFDSGGLREVLNHTDNGRFLVMRGDVAGLAGRIAELVADPELRGVTGGRNLAAASQTFGIDMYRIRQQSLLAGMEARIAAVKAASPVLAAIAKPAVLVRGNDPQLYVLRDGVRYPVTAGQLRLLGLPPVPVQVPQALIASQPLGFAACSFGEAAPLPGHGGAGRRARRKKRAAAAGSGRSGRRSAAGRKPGTKARSSRMQRKSGTGRGQPGTSRSARRSRAGSRPARGQQGRPAASVQRSRASRTKAGKDRGRRRR
ncbi:glycosyltransferase [Paenibacillus sp. N10]|uniref:Glycosyltransferase n=2 Tax=Paenibacillus lutrae TaxID=2078573 RepID=A0A7X3FDX3_9BACL|nr:glycosyltransferase [Paenibacillus lutrae]